MQTKTAPTSAMLRSAKSAGNTSFRLEASGYPEKINHPSIEYQQPTADTQDNSGTHRR